VAHEVTNQGHDCYQLAPMAFKAQPTFGKMALVQK
jgi:hypothetical protein